MSPRAVAQPLFLVALVLTRVVGAVGKHMVLLAKKLTPVLGHQFCRG